jgi:hypothetical protein
LRQFLLGLLLSGCATTHLTERYVLPAEGPTLQRAAEEATQRLGWTTEAVEGGKLRIVDYPRRPKPALTISAEDDVLRIEGDLQRNQPLPEAALVLRSATQQIFDRGPGGKRVSERSPWVAGLLDVLVPSIGGAYALEGDPYFDSRAVGWSRSFLWDVGYRFFIDAAAVMTLAYVVPRLQTGFGISPALILTTEIALLVLNRVGALFTDLSELKYRNAFARSGLSPPEDR